MSATPKRERHLPTCSQWCAVIHCHCGRAAMQGSRTCSAHVVRKVVRRG